MKIIIVEFDNDGNEICKNACINYNARNAVGVS